MMPSFSQKPWYKRRWRGFVYGTNVLRLPLIAYSWSGALAGIRSFTCFRYERRRRRKASKMPFQTSMAAPAVAIPAMVCPAIPPASPVWIKRDQDRRRRPALLLENGSQRTNSAVCELSVSWERWSGRPPSPSSIVKVVAPRLAGSLKVKLCQPGTCCSARVHSALNPARLTSAAAWPTGRWAWRGEAWP